ncbi:unnamed protein product [Calypogeia fissa]
MIFIPKIFEVSGLVTLAFLRDEAALLPDGGELRATTRAKLVDIIPEFNNYWYEGCKVYDTDHRRYCRKPVGPRAGLFTVDQQEIAHHFLCERGDTLFWRFKIGVDDNESYLSGSSLCAFRGRPASMATSFPDQVSPSRPAGRVL